MKQLISFLISRRKKGTSSHMGDHTENHTIPATTTTKDEGDKLHEMLQGEPSGVEAAPNYGGENEENGADADDQLLSRKVRPIVQEALRGLKPVISDHLLEMVRGIHNHIACKQNQELEKKIKDLDMQLTHSLDVQRQLQEEVEMLKPQHSVSNSGSFEDGTPTPPLLKEALNSMQSALYTCAVKMANKVRPSLPHIKKGQLQNIFHNQLCSCLLSDFESSSFGGSQIHTQSLLIFQRPNKDLKRRLYKEFMDYRPESEANLADKHTFFRAFYLSRVNMLALQMCEMPFKSQQQRQIVLANLLQTQSCPLFVDFARLAKTVWLLHKLAFAFEPTAQIFHVNEGMHFDSEYMEIQEYEESATSAPAEVAFMTSPGFTFRNFLFKAQVQLKRNKA